MPGNEGNRRPLTPQELEQRLRQGPGGAHQQLPPVPSHYQLPQYPQQQPPQQEQDPGVALLFAGGYSSGYPYQQQPYGAERGLPSAPGYGPQGESPYGFVPDEPSRLKLPDIWTGKRKIGPIAVGSMFVLAIGFFGAGHLVGDAVAKSKQHLGLTDVNKEVFPSINCATPALSTNIDASGSIVMKINVMTNSADMARAAKDKKFKPKTVSGFFDDTDEHLGLQKRKLPAVPFSGGANDTTRLPEAAYGLTSKENGGSASVYICPLETSGVMTAGKDKTVNVDASKIALAVAPNSGFVSGYESTSISIAPANAAKSPFTQAEIARQNSFYSAASTNPYVPYITNAEKYQALQAFDTGGACNEDLVKKTQQYIQQLVGNSVTINWQNSFQLPSVTFSKTGEGKYIDKKNTKANDFKIINQKTSCTPMELIPLDSQVPKKAA